LTIGNFANGQIWTLAICASGIWNSFPDPIAGDIWKIVQLNQRPERAWP
jgi:hypothetical protein